MDVHRGCSCLTAWLRVGGYGEDFVTITLRNIAKNMPVIGFVVD